MKPNNTAFRKRSQITKANRTMFLWIAGASVLIGFAAVTSIFLGQKLFFNEKVLGEKNHTVSVLTANNAAVSELQTQVRVLDTNESLTKAKAKDTDKAIQTILDALPGEANSLALGASLQTKLLAGIPGLTIESLQVDPVDGIETLTSGAVQSGSSSTSTTSNEITFHFVVSGTQGALRQSLTNLERSIRTIDITSLQIENQGASQRMTVDARAFYEPTKNVVPYDKVLKP